VSSFALPVPPAPASFASCSPGSCRRARSSAPGGCPSWGIDRLKNPCSPRSHRPRTLPRRSLPLPAELGTSPARRPSFPGKRRRRLLWLPRAPRLTISSCCTFASCRIRFDSSLSAYSAARSCFSSRLLWATLHGCRSCAPSRGVLRGADCGGGAAADRLGGGDINFISRL